MNDDTPYKQWLATLDIGDQFGLSIGNDRSVVKYTVTRLTPTQIVATVAEYPYERRVRRKDGCLVDARAYARAVPWSAEHDRAIEVRKLSDWLTRVGYRKGSEDWPTFDQLVAMKKAYDAHAPAKAKAEEKAA